MKEWKERKKGKQSKARAFDSISEFFLFLCSFKSSILLFFSQEAAYDDMTRYDTIRHEHALDWAGLAGLGSDGI